MEKSPQQNSQQLYQKDKSLYVVTVCTAGGHREQSELLSPNLIEVAAQQFFIGDVCGGGANLSGRHYRLLPSVDRRVSGKIR